MEVKMEKNKPKDLYEKAKNKMGYKGQWRQLKELCIL